MRVVVAAACAPQPWANGGGATRDLALAPAAAGAAGPAFDWRLSLADIDRDGPFSRLPGVDRVFALVEGAVALAFDGPARDAASTVARATDVDLDADAEPLAFDGERAPRASLSAAPRTRALNLMLARGRRAGAMRRVRLGAGATLDPAWSRGAAVRACYVVDGRIAVGVATVEAGALVELHDDDPPPVASGSVRLLEIAIRPVTAPAAPGREPGPAPDTDPRSPR